VFVIVYVPGALKARLISPVAVFTKTNPAGDAENIPALEPALKVGNGLLPVWQYGPAYEKVADGALVMVILNVELPGQEPPML
jgi:hypothetical protein